MEVDLKFPSFQNIPIQDLTQPGAARRAAAAMASSLDFDEIKSGQVGIIVTELSRNIALHGGGGNVILSAWKTPHESQIVVLAMDKGRGIKDVGRALEDGFSTAGTSGTGLGAVQRMADRFDLFTQATGTVVLAEIRGKKSLSQEVDEAVGGISIPVNGETICGDNFAVAFSPERSLFMVVDGLGHGPIAGEASTAALEVFYKWTTASPGELVERLHKALKSTRGASIAVAEVMPKREQLVYAGVGNISGVIVSAYSNVSRSMVSHNGIIGHQMAHCVEFTYPWSNDSSLVMHSDGISNLWNLKSYPGLIYKPPAVIAGVLYRDLVRLHDDATVLVARPRVHKFKAA